MNRDILPEQYQILFLHFIYNLKKCAYLLIKDLNGPIFKIVKPFWDFVTYMPGSGVNKLVYLFLIKELVACVKGD